MIRAVDVDIARPAAAVGPGPDDLLGSWELRRRVADLRTGQLGRVAGTLDLVEHGAAVHWHERGELTWGDAVYPVSRELHLERAGRGWLVCFADGRAFHPWAPGQLLTHPCGADRYLGMIRVDRGGTRLRVLWDVTGPGKRQRILTRCSRIQPSSTRSSSRVPSVPT